MTKHTKERAVSVGLKDSTAVTSDPGQASAARPRRRTDPQTLLGRTLAGRYLLLREVGEGGFGIVFEGKDTRLDKRVAVKVLTPSVAENVDALTRFKQEATAAARIGHKSIVDVTDFDQDDDGTHFMVMEFIDGTSLAQALREEAPFSLSRALSIAARIGQALAAAHSRDIVHRDLKPENVLLTTVGPVTDFVKILDFGISKILRFDEGSQTLTGAGQVVGTPRYMAPEQGLGNAVVDGRADIYALGTILYEMVTGVVPFTGATHYEIIHNKASRDPLPPSVVAPQIECPIEVDALILKALARAPEDRYATMVDFEEAIRQLLERVDPAAAAAVKPTTPTPRPMTGLAGHRTPNRSSRSLATVVGKSNRSGQPSAVSALASAGAAGSSAPAVATASAAARTFPRRALYAIAAAGLIAGLALGAKLILPARGGHGTEAVPAPAAPAASAPSPATAAVSAPDVSAAGTTAPTRSAPGGTLVDEVVLRLHVEPAHARVELEGVAVTADAIRLPRSEKAYQLVVSAPGFVTATREIRPIASGDLEVKLEPAPTRPVRSPRRSSRLPDSPL